MPDINEIIRENQDLKNRIQRAGELLGTWLSSPSAEPTTVQHALMVLTGQDRSAPVERYASRW